MIRNGNIIGEYHKQCLPNYSVFDEKRYFEPEQSPCVIDLKAIPTQSDSFNARLVFAVKSPPYITRRAPQPFAGNK